jgi:hypothetical protein
VGMPSSTLCVGISAAVIRTQSVQDGIPTQSVGTSEAVDRICENLRNLR